MKRHGRYSVATAEEILCGIENGEHEYVNSEIMRLKHKHKNDKRGKQKRIQKLNSYGRHQRKGYSR